MTKKQNNTLIIGAGDVGNALALVLKKNHKIFVVDKRIKEKHLDKKFSIMHICFPFDKSFINSCQEYIRVYKPSLTIINSTVAVGTTEEIAKKTRTAVVHSPVIGDHNNLYEGIKNFTKTIGATDKRWGQKATRHFHKAGLKTKTFNSPKITELGKVLLTTQFALNIAFHQEMERVCKKYGVDFSKTATDFKIIFNNGYSKIRPNVVMPNLFPGKIGGSCLMQNIRILEKQYRSDFFKAIQKSNDRKK